MHVKIGTVSYSSKNEILTSAKHASHDQASIEVLKIMLTLKN